MAGLPPQGSAWCQWTPSEWRPVGVAFFASPPCSRRPTASNGGPNARACSSRVLEKASRLALSDTQTHNRRLVACPQRFWAPQEKGARCAFCHHSALASLKIGWQSTAVATLRAVRSARARAHTHQPASLPREMPGIEECKHRRNTNTGANENIAQFPTVSYLLPKVDGYIGDAQRDQEADQGPVVSECRKFHHSPSCAMTPNTSAAAGRLQDGEGEEETDDGEGRRRRLPLRANLPAQLR